MLNSLIQASLEVLGSYKGGMLNALVWGVKNGLGWGTYDEFKRVGLVHILVASGANVVFLVEAVVNSLAWLVGRKKAIVFGLVLGWWYSLSVGFGAPIIRGVLFVTLRYVAVILGRGFSWARNLVLVLVISLLADGRLFLSDSLWLSVVAFVGIASFTDLKKVELKSKVLEEFVKGLWVGLWVLPLVAIKFGSISLLSPVVSALTFWLLEPLVVVGASAGVIYMIIPYLGKIIFVLAEVPLDCLIWIVSVFKNVPGGMVEIEVERWQIIGWYMALFIIYLLLVKKLKNR